MITLQPNEPPHLFDRGLWWLFPFLIVPLLAVWGNQNLLLSLLFPVGVCVLFYLRAKSIQKLKEVLSTADVTYRKGNVIFFLARGKDGFLADQIDISEYSSWKDDKVYSQNEVLKFYNLMNSRETGVTAINPGVFTHDGYLAFTVLGNDQYKITGTAQQDYSAAEIDEILELIQMQTRQGQSKGTE